MMGGIITVGCIFCSAAYLVRSLQLDLDLTIMVVIQ